MNKQHCCPGWTADATAASDHETGIGGLLSLKPIVSASAAEAGRFSAPTYRSERALMGGGYDALRRYKARPSSLDVSFLVPSCRIHFLDDEHPTVGYAPSNAAGAEVGGALSTLSSPAASSARLRQ